MFGKDWLRGPLTDWLFTAVLAPFATTLGVIYTRYNGTPAENPEIVSLQGFWNWVISLDWQGAFVDGLPAAAVIMPVFVWYLRWHRAGEPLPDRATEQGYTGLLVATTAMQAAGVGTAWAFYITSSLTGQDITSILTGLPSIALSLIGAVLLLGLTVGLFGPSVFMYLDARYLDDQEVLTVFDSPRLLLWIPILGAQLAGIPTVLAVYYYFAKRERAEVTRVVYGEV